MLAHTREREHTVTGNNEAHTPKILDNYLSYFVIIWYSWISQVSYDVRFQAEDWYHRLMKLVQLIVLTYLGAGSGHWSPTDTVQNNDYLDPDALAHLQAERSFLTTTIAYACSRALLMAQYIVLVPLGAKANRPVKGIILSAGIIGFSMILVIVAAALPPSSQAVVAARVALLFAAILIEFVGEAVVSSLKSHTRCNAEQVAERMSALTLIILGEGASSPSLARYIAHSRRAGFVTLLKTFNIAFTGFSADDHNVFIAAFCVVVSIFIVFLFAFSDFTTARWIGQKNTFVWIFLHFPLHFLLLLLLNGLVVSGGGSRCTVATTDARAEQPDRDGVARRRDWRS